MSRLVQYDTLGAPLDQGVYACRVPDESGVPGLLDDIFLTWYIGRWWYPGSDQRYRGDVLGWIGPLQRRLPK